MIPITPKKGFEINENTEVSCEEIKIGWGAIKQADNYLMVIRNTTSINTSCVCAEVLCHPLWAEGASWERVSGVRLRMWGRVWLGLGRKSSGEKERTKGREKGKN